MNKILLILFVSVNILFSYDNVLDTDIVARTINFIIFAVIMYILISKPLKDFLKSRQNSISEKFTDYEEKYTLLKRQFQKTKDKHNSISTKTKELIIQAHKEAKEIEKTKLEELEQTLVNMKKSSNSYLTNKQSMAKQKIIECFIEDIFESNELQLKLSDFVNIIEKKVSI